MSVESSSPGSVQKVGVVVPNFNCANYLRSCIDSILEQSVPVSVLVVDGGSTDGSLEILATYGDRISFISEPDNGQADAINKGFRRLGREVQLLGWLNSDDRLLPNAIETIVASAHRRTDCVLFHGDVELIDEHGRLFGRTRSGPLTSVRMRQSKCTLTQPGSFYRTDAIVRCGGVQSSYHLLMDLDLWLRLLDVGGACYLSSCLAQFRVHAAAKSSAPPYRYYVESLQVAKRYPHGNPILHLLRKMRVITRHYLIWSLGLRKRRSLAAPSSPPIVFFPESVAEHVPSDLSLKDFAVRVEESEQPLDVVFEYVNASVFAPTKLLLWPASAVVACVGPDVVDVAGFRPHVERVAFWLASPTQQVALRDIGCMPHRLGSLYDSSDWLRALRVALGDSSALVSKPGSTLPTGSSRP